MSENWSAIRKCQTVTSLVITVKLPLNVLLSEKRIANNYNCMDNYDGMHEVR